MAKRRIEAVAIVVTVIAMTSLGSGCGSSSDGSTTPATSSGSSGTSGQTSSGLSLAFASNCARCHGTTATGQGIYPSLPGNLTAASFIATVRAGKKVMPSFDASQISDADLTADYQWMKTKR
jgi:mono/diheme cytochrome c family protein